MKNIFANLTKMRKGKVVYVTVYDCFQGYVKILKNRFLKWYVEIVDVEPCYKCQSKPSRGEKFWILHNELLYDDSNDKNFSNEYLPF